MHSSIMFHCDNLFGYICDNLCVPGADGEGGANGDGANEDDGMPSNAGKAVKGNSFKKTMYMCAVTRCSFNRRQVPGTFAFFAQGWCKRRRRCEIVCLDFGSSLAFQ